jgi:cbb3-type cytochrome oxidase subunit 1
VTPPSENQTLTYAFAGTLAVTFVFYVMRGFGVPIFTDLPGIVLLILILASIVVAIIYGVQATRRY